MRRMLEYRTWTISSEDLADLVNNYNGEDGDKPITQDLLDLITTSNEINITDESGVEILPRKYYTMNKQDGNVSDYVITFGQWEPNLQEGGFNAGHWFSFNIFKVLDGWAMSIYTDEL